MVSIPEVGISSVSRCSVQFQGQAEQAVALFATALYVNKHALGAFDLLFPSFSKFAD